MPPEQSAFLGMPNEEYKRVESMRDQPQSTPGGIIKADAPPSLLDHQNVTASVPIKQIVDEKDNLVLETLDKTWPNGNRYKGQVLPGTDKRHGQGEWIWSNGQRYVGQFKQN